MKKVNQDAINKGITKVYLSKKTGKSVSTISQYMNGKTMVPFSSYHTIINIIYEYDETTIERLVYQYCMLPEITPINIKTILEWGIQQGKIQLLDEFIRKKEIPPQLTSIISLYSALLSRIKNNVNKSEFYRFIEENRIPKNTDPEAKVLADIAKYYAFIDMGGHEIIHSLIDQTYVTLKEIESKYVHDAYSIRLAEVKAICEMKSGNTTIAKKIVKKIDWEYNEEDFPIIFTSLYSLIAEITAAEDFNESQRYIKKALKVIQKGGYPTYRKRLIELKATHDFIKIYHEDFKGLYLETKPEIAFYYSLNSNEDLAIRILNELEEEQGQLTPFQTFSLALAKHEITLAEQAIHELRRKGNNYYADLLSKKVPEWFKEESYFYLKKAFQVK